MKSKTTLNPEQLDDSTSLYRKWLFHQPSILDKGLLFGLPGQQKKMAVSDLKDLQLCETIGRFTKTKNLQQIGHRKKLVGGFNPSEKYARQIGSFAQVGMKIQNV